MKSFPFNCSIIGATKDLRKIYDEISKDGLVEIMLILTLNQIPSGHQLIVSNTTTQEPKAMVAIVL